MKFGSNYGLIILLCLIFSAWVFSFTDLYITSKYGLVLFVLITLLFLDSLGKSIPIKELIGQLMLMQMLVCPVIVYNYFDNEMLYPMDVNEEVYLNFVFPAILFYLAGLFIPINKKKLDLYQIINNIEINKTVNSKIGVVLVLIGYSISLLNPFVPATLGFLMFLLINFKFIGAIYLLFSNNRFKYLWITTVWGFYIYETVGGGIFINLFVWGLLLAIFFAFRFRFTLIMKILLFVGGAFIVFFINSFKAEYRTVLAPKSIPVYSERVESKQKVFLEMATEKVITTEGQDKYSDLNDFISRLNQGWIFAKVLDHVPDNEPFTGGETFNNDIYGAVVPRFLDPNKTVRGGKEGAKKFERFTGRRLLEGTTMTIGILGDAYVNFGFIGGFIFMFAFGLVLNLMLYWIYDLSRIYPTLILWVPFIFFYTMRAGNEFGVVLNFMTKSLVVVFGVFYLYKKQFRIEKAI